MRNSVVRSPIVLAIFLTLLAVAYLFVRYYAKSNIFLFVKFEPPNDNKGYKEINLKGTTAYLKFKDDEENKIDRKDDTIILSFQGSNGIGIDGIDLCKSEDGKFIKSVASVTYTGSFGTGEGSNFRKIIKISERTVYADAEKLYDYVTKKLGYGKVILVGYSFGGPVAAHIANYAENTNNNKVKKIVLRSPANGIEYVTSYCTKSKFLGKLARFATLGIGLNTFGNLKKLKNKNLPIYLFSGGEEDFLNLKKIKLEECLKEANFKKIKATEYSDAGHFGKLDIASAFE